MAVGVKVAVGAKVAVGTKVGVGGTGLGESVLVGTCVGVTETGEGSAEVGVTGSTEGVPGFAISVNCAMAVCPGSSVSFAITV
jgi:hypothetical protein